MYLSFVHHKYDNNENEADILKIEERKLHKGMNRRHRSCMRKLRPNFCWSLSHILLLKQQGFFGNCTEDNIKISNA